VAAGFVAVALGTPAPAAAPRAWQSIQPVSVAEAASRFADPPPEYGPSVTWGWDAARPDSLAHDLDLLKARGFRSATIEAGFDMPAKYLSPEWFALVRGAVLEAKKRDMRVWIIDEGKYPSGFAGGKFTAERPDLRMQALMVMERVPVAPGATLRRALGEGELGAAAVNLADSTSSAIPVSGGSLSWTAPAGRWEVWIAGHRFRTSPTRWVDNPVRNAKDGKASLFDYLDPTGTRQFIAWTHEGYRAALEDEFGKTVLGFRGDEPDFGFTPWTPRLLEEFRARKGYDLRPYLAAILAPHPAEKVKRVRADYQDVWSEMFGKAFFDVQADWAAAHEVEYMVHLNHEDMLPWLARSEGDYFRDMRNVQIPGVDAIWNQIWPGKVSDFPKFASSAAHLSGHPRAMSESFAAYNPRPSVAEVKWVVDQQLVRGINLFEFMFYSSTSSGRGGPRGWMGSDSFPAVADHTARASYLLSLGRPAARLAVFLPNSSLWLGDERADSAFRTLSRQLLEAQRDFDFVDEQSLAELLKPVGRTLRNQSGQGYEAVLLPSSAVLSKPAMDRLRAFAAAGGTVVFVGETPALLSDRTYRDATPAPPPTWAVREPSGQVTPAVLAALPAPDFSLAVADPDVKYNHRHLTDGEVYFVFNEGSEPYSGPVTLAGRGRVEEWDADSGAIRPLPAATQAGENTRLPLDLAPHATRILVIRR
jgi:hypothetical protein